MSESTRDPHAAYDGDGRLRDGAVENDPAADNAEAVGCVGRLESGASRECPAAVSEPSAELPDEERWANLAEYHRRRGEHKMRWYRIHLESLERQAVDG